MDNPDPKFYEAMNYPVPVNKIWYTYINEIGEKSESENSGEKITENFSRTSSSDLMKSYQDFLSGHMSFLKHIPFVSQIYLCNSITFNALHPGSDIDLCIITKPGYLWYARLWSWLFFSFLDLKRRTGLGDHSYKFCLSFYLDGDNTNIISLRKQQGDIYLSYRIAHAVLLYTNNHYPDNHIYLQNKQLLDYLPYHPKMQTIFLNIQKVIGESSSKKISEKILSTLPGQWIQKLIKNIRGGIINTYKTSKLSVYNQKHIIISPTMLKFHTDKRSVYQHRRNMASNKRKKEG